MTNDERYRVCLYLLQGARLNDMQAEALIQRVKGCRVPSRLSDYAPTRSSAQTFVKAMPPGDYNLLPEECFNDCDCARCRTLA